MLLRDQKEKVEISEASLLLRIDFEGTILSKAGHSNRRTIGVIATLGMYKGSLLEQGYLAA